MRFSAWVFGTVLACTAQEQANFRVSVDLVPVTCAVTSRDGQPIRNMQADEFLVLDNGTPRPVQYLWQEVDMPLTIGLIVDISGSQGKFVGEHRQAIAQFLEQVLRPQDQAFLVAVGPRVRLVTGLTHSVQDLAAGIKALEPRKVFDLRDTSKDFGDQCTEAAPTGLATPRHRMTALRNNWWCGTLLWNGIYSAAHLMKPVSGRKALLVLTDGLDVGSSHSLTDAVEAAQSADTMVYTIHYGVSLEDAPMPRFVKLLEISRERNARAGLRRVSEETGGRAYRGSKDSPAGIFAEIDLELRSLYVLAFTAPETARDGGFHKLEVKLKRSGVRVRARNGYLAASL